MTSTAPVKKPGPKGKILEPYATDILSKERAAESYQSIVNWLAQPPRNVVISRQAVHRWVRDRINKLERRNAKFANTWLSAPFEGVKTDEPTAPSIDGEPASSSSSEREGEATEVACAPVPPAANAQLPTASRRRVDLDDFMVDEATGLTQNPLL